MLKKNGVVALTLMALQHSYTRQEKHGHVKHLRLRLVTGRNVSSRTEFINMFPWDLPMLLAVTTMELYVLNKS